MSKLPNRRGVFSKLQDLSYTKSVVERCLSILYLNDLGPVPKEREILLQRYRTVNGLLREGVVSSSVEKPRLLKKVETLFLMLHRYQSQLEGTVRCLEKTINLYGLQGYASTFALSPEDIQVQLKIYEHLCSKLRDLPQWISPTDHLDTCSDPALLAKYQELIRVDHSTLNEIYGDVFTSKADACVTFSKLCFGREFGGSRFDSVLIHPLIPGEKGSLLVSPSLLLDSLFFRFSTLLSLVD